MVKHAETNVLLLFRKLHLARFRQKNVLVFADFSFSHLLSYDIAPIKGIPLSM